jgi:hypothetical protein
VPFNDEGGAGQSRGGGIGAAPRARLGEETQCSAGGGSRPTGARS